MDRLLRTYQHVAQKDHWCDNCCSHIQPGEMYEGSVHASKAFGLYVFKVHVYPSCDPPENPDFEDADDNKDKEPASPQNIADIVEDSRNTA